jgi:hypothetical protein
MKGGEIVGNTVGKDNENVGIGGGGILLNLCASSILFKSSFEVKGGVIYGKDGANANTLPAGSRGSAAYISPPTT